MSVRLLFVFALVAAVATAEGQTPSSSGALDLLLPAAGKVVRVRLEISVSDFDPEAAWERFLDRWFDYFDRDSDGALSRVEAARALPLPSSAGKEISLDFAHADANTDGKLTRIEFKANLRAAGFTPVVARVQPADPIVKQLSDVILRHLDRSGKGQITRGDFERAGDLLRKFDDNEDEVLTSSELLIGAPKNAGLMKSEVRIIPAERDRPADSALRLALPKHSSASRSVGPRHSLGATCLTVDSRNIAWRGPARTSRLFCLAQFDNLRGDQSHLEKKQLERDPAARLILALFDAADRDGDGQLTDAEIRRFLDLVDEGSMCQLIIVIEDRGQSLFDALDVNGDGRLDYRELLDAPTRFEASAPGDAVVVPFSLTATVQRGAAAQSFGPLPLAAAPPPSAQIVERIRNGPRWFQAMDHNQDGFVSPFEFVGPIHIFRRLDANGDGLVSADEADRVVAIPPTIRKAE